MTFSLSLLQKDDLEFIQNQDDPWLTRFSLEPSSLAMVWGPSTAQKTHSEGWVWYSWSSRKCHWHCGVQINLKFHRLEVISVFRCMTTPVPNTLFTICIVSPGAPAGRFSWSLFISWPNPAPCHRVLVSESSGHQGGRSSLCVQNTQLTERPKRKLDLISCYLVSNYC